MSIIPKIKVGMPKKREKLNLSFDCSTTANIGGLQPTMCREMVPNETFEVKVASLARLRPLVVPTFGRMSLRHYHTFVSYRDIWEPFENMLSGQHYVNDSNSYIPTATPYFTMESIIREIIMKYSDVTMYKGYDIVEENAITFDPVNMTIAEAQAYVQSDIEPAWNMLRNSKLFGGSISYKFNDGVQGSLAEDGYGVVNLGQWYFAAKYNETPTFNPLGNNNVIRPYPTGGAIIGADGADFITSVIDTDNNNQVYTFCFKLRPVAKRFRKMMIGLGYQFSPYSVDTHFCPFKLVAYYKAWFELFRPVRQKAFVDTNCYKLTHAWRQASCNGANVDTALGTIWNAFLKDLANDCYYYLPMDYFSMATTSPQQPNSDVLMDVTTPYGVSATGHAIQNSSNGAANQYAIEGNFAGSQFNPLVAKMAMRLLTFANKNTIVGRSVRQWLKVHYGVDGGDQLDSNGVVRIGASRTNIQISDVMNTAASPSADLGEYAGKGIGYGDAEKFDYTAKYFGCWLTLTVVVPESGYFQGYLQENRHMNRYQFFMDEFDACGYQVLELGEVIDDYNCDGASFNPKSGFSRSAGFGFVPRYSEYKVGRNIVNGDLSIPGNYNDGAPYTLDRRFPAGALGYKIYLEFVGDQTTKITTWKVARAVETPWMPSTVNDNFRRIDPTDHLGQYNRIFAITDTKDDNFILNMIFNVDAYAPMKSLTSSFDAVQEDDKVIDVAHS
jgi:hypothetical protein